MNQTQTITPTKRINSIDVLRGFALMGIFLLHCMEHFDLTFFPQIESPLWQKIDTVVYDTIRFLFQGKSYAIFSLLFGLGFFMQMDSNAKKGSDFRLRFAWRLTILLFLGYLNGMVYMGEFFVIYAILGLLLIPLWRVPTRWLIVITALLFLQIPQVIQFVSLLSGIAPNEPSALNVQMNDLFGVAAQTFSSGSLLEVLRFNSFEGQFAKILWFINEYRYPQIIGLIILGMLIGRSGVHKSEEMMVKYSKKVLPCSIAWFALFYAIAIVVSKNLDGTVGQVGRGLFVTYSNLGLMMMYISGLTLLYYGSGSWRRSLEKLAPVGRMSVTNYMVQSLLGVIIFYGFGLGLAVKCSFLECALVGLAVCAFQIWYSNLWMKKFYYGPMEWLWRSLTWFQRVPMRRN